MTEAGSRGQGRPRSDITRKLSREGGDPQRPWSAVASGAEKKAAYFIPALALSGHTLTSTGTRMKGSHHTEAAPPRDMRGREGGSQTGERQLLSVLIAFDFSTSVSLISQMLPCVLHPDADRLGVKWVITFHSHSQFSQFPTNDLSCFSYITKYIPEYTLVQGLCFILITPLTSF